MHSPRLPYDPQSHKGLSFHDAVPGFVALRDTPSAYLERCLVTIEQREPEVRAWQAMDIAAARQAAQAATARYRIGRPLSSIDGMPVGIKDLIQTRDLPTGEGIRGNDAACSGNDSACVQALRAAGAVIVGKLVTTELGGGAPSKTKNPFDASRSPGGSSSGCGAAIGAGMLPVAIGTQVGGSIIRPAGYCGNFAFKPSFGALHRGERQSSSQSCIGVHAGSLPDLWRVAHEIASRTGGDPGHPGLAGPAKLAPANAPRSLAVMECSGWRETTGAARAAFQNILAQVQHAGVKLLRRGEHAELDAFEASLENTAEFVGVILDFENRWYVENLARRLDSLHPSTLRSLERARHLSVADYRHALALRGHSQALFRMLSLGVDALISPSAPAPAPLIDAPAPSQGQPIYVATGNPVFNLPGSMLLAPVITLPLMAVDGLPLGVQLIGHGHADHRLHGLARWAMENLRPVSVHESSASP
jgi:Asp-tRNA(Asn)/Glu-tRNA(Gln) amidotransferase A subunit family amidase